MADVQGKASVIPKHVTWENFDVMTGGADASKEEYYQSVFHTSDNESGDSVFKAKADLLGSSGDGLLGNENQNEFPDEDKAEKATLAQVKEAAL